MELALQVIFASAIRLYLINQNNLLVAEAACTKSSSKLPDDNVLKVMGYSGSTDWIMVTVS